jgi:hypothetical protein
VGFVAFAAARGCGAFGEAGEVEDGVGGFPRGFGAGELAPDVDGAGEVGEGGDGPGDMLEGDDSCAAFVDALEALDGFLDVGAVHPFFEFAEGEVELFADVFG